MAACRLVRPSVDMDGVTGVVRGRGDMGGWPQSAKGPPHGFAVVPDGAQAQFAVQLQAPG